MEESSLAIIISWPANQNKPILPALKILKDFGSLKFSDVGELLEDFNGSNKDIIYRLAPSDSGEDLIEFLTECGYVCKLHST